MKPQRMRLFRAFDALVVAVVGLCFQGAAADSSVRYTPAQSRYLEGCGGCHGIDGRSPKTGIPELRASVGVFLCTAAGRQYLVRLPNVAFAEMDDELLAEVMNLVVFGFGGESVPTGALPYSAREVSILRRQPLKNEDLARLRKEILADGVSRCERRDGKLAYTRKGGVGE